MLRLLCLAQLLLTLQLFPFRSLGRCDSVFGPRPTSALHQRVQRTIHRLRPARSGENG